MIKNSSTKDLNLSSNERLSLKNTSVFKPKTYARVKHNGYKIFTFHAGFKKKFDDLLIIVFDELVNCSIVYSKTSTPSAPIIWDKKHNNGKVKALIVNSGNANAHTGKEGIEIINDYVKSLSKHLGCKKNQILVSSTGVIGELFDPNIIIKQILKLKNKQENNLLGAAKSIMTTDTYPKLAIKKTKINGKEIKIYGFAKGSGMINPNMGTMLVYIFIEADIPSLILKKLLRNNLDTTFNSISVDSDTSTSDTIIIFSLKKEKANFSHISNYNKLNSTLHSLMKDLSLQVIKDGEGLSKLTKINVLKAKSKNEAKNIALSIVNSPLVKTAIAGQDPNWGRVIMAIGKTGEKINQNKLEVSFGNNLVCQNGSINKKINAKKLNKYMKNNIIEINVNLNNGSKYHTVYGNDLTHEYIKINADYRS